MNSNSIYHITPILSPLIQLSSYDGEEKLNMNVKLRLNIVLRWNDDNFPSENIFLSHPLVFLRSLKKFISSFK